MKLGTFRTWEQTVREVAIPEQGMRLDAFGAAMRIDPSDIEQATTYLHRKKLIWRSVQRGHARIFPQSRCPGRGRPAGERPAASLMPAQAVAFLAGLMPMIGSIVILMARMPKGGWQDQPELQAEIRRSIAVEAKAVMSETRKLVEQRGYPVALVRTYLWATFAGVMPVVAELESDLALGDAPLTPIAVPEPKKAPPNLPADERVHRYVKAAGVFGIGAYEIAAKTGQTMKRAEIEKIAFRLEDSGLLYTAEARTADRGRKGMRLYSTAHGKPIIGSDGRRLMPL